MTRCAWVLSLGIFWAGCGDAAPQPDTPPCGGGQGVAALGLSDYSTGALGCVNLVTGETRRQIDTADPQVAVRSFGGLVYTLDQTHGVLRVYDPARGWRDPSEISLGHAAVPASQGNPVDVYVEPTGRRAYVTLYGAAMSTRVDAAHALAVVELLPGAAGAAGVTGFIPLPLRSGDPDGNPDAARMFACDGTLYVLLQDLDRTRGYVPLGAGRLAAVRLADQAVTYMDLVGQNPTSVSVAEDCRAAVIGSAGTQLLATPGGGGIEQVDLVQRKSRLLVADRDLGGNVSNLAVTDAAARWAYVDLLTRTGAQYSHDVYAVDLVNAQRGARLLGPMNYVAGIRAALGRVLVLSAGTPAPGQLGAGLYVGPADGSVLVGKPYDLGLPPVSAALIQ